MENLLKFLLVSIVFYLISFTFFCQSMKTKSCKKISRRCKKDVHCNSIFQSIENMCRTGDYSCSLDDELKKNCTQKINKLRSNSVFKHGCTCFSVKKQMMIGGGCSDVHNLIFANPCYVVDYSFYRPHLSLIEPTKPSKISTTATEALIEQENSSSSHDSKKLMETTRPVFATSNVVEENEDEMFDYWEKYLEDSPTDKKTNKPLSEIKRPTATQAATEKENLKTIVEEVLFSKNQDFEEEKEDKHRQSLHSVDSDVKENKNPTTTLLLSNKKTEFSNCNTFSRRKTFILVFIVFGILLLLCFFMVAVATRKRWKCKKVKKTNCPDKGRQSVIYIKQDHPDNDTRSYQKYLQV